MPIPKSSNSSSMNNTDKRPDALDRSSKSASNINMSFRSIGRMGHSMSTLMSKKRDEKKMSATADNKHDEKDILEKTAATPLRTIDIPKEVWEAQQENLLYDILEVRRAMDLFLNSRIPEAERILEPKRYSSLYHSLGHAFVMFLKSMMTFQHSDIKIAIEALKKTIQLADAMRKKKSQGWLGNLTSWMKGLTVHDVWSMSRLHQHAELVYAESYLLKALLSIIHDESFVSFLREGLHVRSSYNTYKILQKFLLHVQEQALLGKDISSCELDDHFTSGVSLGVGLFNLVISMLPTSVIKIVELVGFTADRSCGMTTLESAGGWEEYAGLPLSKLPPPQEPNEGLRRQFCDMVLLMYHIILPKLIPIPDVNEELADRILAYSLKLYPDGVFFLYFSGRQLSARCQLTEAISQYQKAIDMQKDWKQLQHMCYWELGLIRLLQQDWQKALDCYTILQKESNWSKAVYYYMQAISLYLLSNAPGHTKEEQASFTEQAHELMRKVTGAKRKIAGKSIFLEKFVARKARKFVAQNNRLLFPDLEILIAFSAFDFMPEGLLLQNLERTNDEIQHLIENSNTNNTEQIELLNYYDDLCLSHYLRIMVLRLLLERTNTKKIQEWKNLQEESIRIVMENANKIQLDHYIYYFTRYEEARMMISNKNFDKAKEIIQSIIRCSEKNQFNVGAGPHAENKYSLENTLLFRCHNCLTEIDQLSLSVSPSSTVDDNSDKLSSTNESFISASNGS
ncbi:hypothetical protein BDF20DRAFT_895081 [Mycotypha africana]|uniref:uncharacterized protein n=1 Tax=Mycotypha africana TaxID=64632 RepID=UPI002300DF1F|nr:uncharacterized protein BDF20DRAFT_895081 [Mycotypha africana]KAI8968235.1 hypothetical protein BDF20DRAFT_895081 [Mycotypha africana]